ncbi:universal stress protein [Acidianus sp.]|uniref:universal stress protein n=1 Tax=Acidianus sp. TaxID=1872104 RepID=UPI0039787F17
MFEKILVAYDGSEHSKKALDVAIDLAKRYSSEVYVVEAVDETIFETVGVLPPLSAIEEMEKKAKKDIDEAVNKATQNGVKAVGEVLSGDPATAILEYANKNDIKLIIIGSRGLSRFKRILLGSVSSRVVQESKIPVIVVK